MIGIKYKSNEEALIIVIWTMANLVIRFKNKDSKIYDFLFSNILSENPKIKLAIYSSIALMPQFDEYEKKWEFISEIPLAKGKERDKRIRLFRRSLVNRIKDIPDKFKSLFREIFIS